MFLQKVNSINVLLYKDHHVHKQLSVIISIEWRRRFINYRSLILDKNFQITSLQENKDKLLVVNFSLFKCSSSFEKKNKVHIRVYFIDIYDENWTMRLYSGLHIGSWGQIGQSWDEMSSFKPSVTTSQIHCIQSLNGKNANKHANQGKEKSMIQATFLTYKYQWYKTNFFL